MSEGLSNPVPDPLDLQKKAVEITKGLFSGIYILREDEQVEEEGEILTLTKLRNMLEAARDARKKGSWDLFKLRVIYIARDTEQGDQLYNFVRNLLTAISREEHEEERRLELAEQVLTASIYMYNALKMGFENLIFER